MGKGKSETDIFFTELCETYYPRVLRYLYAVLGDESAARDCTQEVFLTACQKCALLMQHQNPGGFLFVTAKNLSRKWKREAFARMTKESSMDEDAAAEPADTGADIHSALDRAIDETAYIDRILDTLSPEKRSLYTQHYVCGKSMADIAAQLGLEETAVRMRFVRLRREIRAAVARVAQQHFIS